jgi:hypothetical protein
MFQLPSRKSPNADVDEQEQSVPPWWGPPEDELGACVAESVVIARSGRGVVALSHVLAYSTGAQLQFVAIGRGVKQSQVHTMFHAQHLDADEEIPDEFLRIGLELANGARVSNLGGRWTAGRSFGEKPDEPVFHQSDGGGGSGTRGGVRMRPAYWLWPLPPTGPLSIWCEWPAVDIALASVEIDAAEIVAAAAKSVPLEAPST